MKMKNCSLLFVCFTLFVISCSKDGSNGVDGTNGTNGANGTNGTNGTNGKDGKTTLTKTTKEAPGANCTYGGTKFETGLDANNNGILDNSEVITTQTKYVCDGAGAVYSSWIDVNVTDTLQRLEEEQEYSYKQLLPAAALTADIADKGMVLMYYKSRNGIIVSVDRDDIKGIIDTDTTKQTFEFQAGYVFKERYLSFLANDNRMNDNGSAVRYLLIPGMVQGRSMADLQQLPYSEIAKLYNIKN
jgi:hypothetical protein